MKKKQEGVIKTAVYKEVRLQRIFVHNGIALYSTWTTIASVSNITFNDNQRKWLTILLFYGHVKLLNINIAFQYFGNCDAETTSLVCTAVLLTILIGWFVLENTWLDSYVRYTIAQYPGLFTLFPTTIKVNLLMIFLSNLVIIFATSGILSKQAERNRPDGPVPESIQILTWIILGVASAQLVVRLVLVIYRYRTQPLFKIQSISAREEILTVQAN